MSDGPSGTVTFLFTDVEGSTKLLERFPDSYPAAIEQHHSILCDAVDGHGGQVFETIGDAVYAAFSRAADCVAAALAAQRRLQSEPCGEIGEIRVRMGIHTGDVQRQGTHYFGRALYRCARLMSVGHGGQVLISSLTADLVRGELPADAVLRSLGTHRLKDLAEPEHVHELVHPAIRSGFPPLRSLESHPNNLVSQLDEFIGRERETAAVCELFSRARLVTLLGPGGTGKTRLSLQVAAEMVGRFDGVFFVALAGVNDPGLVVPAIAQTLGLRQTAGWSWDEVLADHLRDRELLVVLDNLEQVLGAAGRVGELLARSPGLRVLVTSREPLRISGEHRYAVPPLDVDTEDAGAVPSPAVRLFVERARSARPGFALNGATATVTEICRRLDGLPLAIELAAARMNVLAPKALLDRLERRLPLLVGGSRDRPERQQTLRAAITWSYELLSDPERRLFEGLGVFRGGWTMEAASAVCGADSDLGLDVLDGLGSLADKSLIKRDDLPNSSTRFSMLETIREFANEKLSDAKGALRRRHAEHFVARAELLASMTPVEAGHHAASLGDEQENVRAALEWVLDAADATLALRYAATLRALLRDNREIRTWHAQLLGVPGTEAASTLRWTALMAAGGAAFVESDLTAMRTIYEEISSIGEATSDDEARLAGSFGLAMTAGMAGDIALAEQLSEAHVALLRSLGRPESASAAMNRANMLRDKGDFAGAEALYGRLLEAAERANSFLMIAMILGNLGELHYARGNYQRADEAIGRSLDIRRRHRDLSPSGNTDLLIAAGVLHCAAVSLLRGDLSKAATHIRDAMPVLHRWRNARYLAACFDAAAAAVAALEPRSAATMLGTADALRDRIGATDPLPNHRFMRDRASEAARRALGDTQFGEHLRAGREMPLHTAVDFALERVTAADPRRDGVQAAT